MTSELGATDTAAKISAYVTSFPEEKLPEKVASFQALRLLDNVGCAIAGWNSIGVAELHGLTPELKNGPVTLPIRGGRMSLRDVTFLHSVMARAHDYCDVVSPGYHPGSTDVPVALAMGAAYRRSGAELLCALALGMNVAIRLNNAAQANGVSYRGFDPNVLALFSGTVVAGRLAGLNARQMHSALGFAFNHGVGTFQMYSDKTEAVRIAQGTVSAACIDAVSLAAAGMTGVRRVFEGEDGFFKLYAPGEKDASWLSFDLDSALLGSESTCFKLYPSCSVTLALTDACLRLRERSAGWLSADELPRVRLRVSSTMNRVCGHAFDPGSTPSINAMFSVQYVAANALLRGRSSLQEFSRDAVMDSRVFDFAQSIEVICMPDYSPFDSCEVELSKGGEVLDMVAAHHGRGWPQNPASASELVRKFQANVEFAELDWLRKRSDQMVDCILNLGSRKQGPMETSLLLQPTAHQTSISLA